MENKNLATIGIFGGSGFYKFLDDIQEVFIDTPYGKTSDALMIGTIAGKKVAFIPRHGKNHRFLPHLVNYRAKTVFSDRGKIIDVVKTYLRIEIAALF